MWIGIEALIGLRDPDLREKGHSRRASIPPAQATVQPEHLLDLVPHREDRIQ